MLRIILYVNAICYFLNFTLPFKIEGKAYSQIIPINHNWFIINELAKNPLYNNQKTVFIINLYNNIFNPNQFMGSNEWISDRKKYLQTYFFQETQDQLCKEIEALENYLSYEPVNPVIGKLITEVQTNSHCFIFGLAERSSCSIPLTTYLITKNKITFSENLKYRPKHSILKHGKDSQIFIFFTAGVIFSNFNDLISVFNIFFQQQQYHINTLIYLDSSKDNLEILQKYCEYNEINFFGLLNNENTNKYVKQKKAASILIQGITNLLSDKAAAHSLLILFQNTLTN